MKKIISVLLSVLMIASFCTFAFAAEAKTADAGDDTMVVLAAPAEAEETSEGETVDGETTEAVDAVNESTSEETTLEETSNEEVTDAANANDGVSPVVIVLVVLAVAVVAVAVVLFLKKKGKE